MSNPRKILDSIKFFFSNRPEDKEEFKEKVIETVAPIANKAVADLIYFPMNLFNKSKPLIKELKKWPSERIKEEEEKEKEKNDPFMGI